MSLEMYRQGDVLVIRAPENTSTKNMVPVPRDAGRVVLAYGEVTGHCHALVDDGVTLYEPTDMSKNKERILHIVKNDDGPVMLRHDEHGPIPLKPGLYIVRRQREYTPEAIRNVAD